MTDAGSIRKVLESTATDPITLQPLRHPGVNEGTIISQYTHWSMGSKGLYSRDRVFELAPIKCLEEVIDMVYPHQPPRDIDELLVAIDRNIHVSTPKPYTRYVDRNLLTQDSMTMTTWAAEKYFLPNAEALLAETSEESYSHPVVLYTRKHAQGIQGYLTSRGQKHWVLGSTHPEHPLGRLIQEIGGKEGRKVENVSFIVSHASPSHLKVALFLTPTSEDLKKLLDAPTLRELLEALCKDTACKRVPHEKFAAAVDLLVYDGLQVFLTEFLRAYSPRPEMASTEMRPLLRVLLSKIFERITDPNERQAMCKTVLETIARAAIWTRGTKYCFFKALDIELSLFFSDYGIVAGNESRDVLSYLLPVFPTLVLRLFHAHTRGPSLNSIFLATMTQVLMPYFYRDQWRNELTTKEVEGSGITAETLSELHYEMEAFCRREDALKVIAEIVTKALLVALEEVLELREKHWFEKFILCLVESNIYKCSTIFTMCRRLGLDTDLGFIAALFNSSA